MLLAEIESSAEQAIKICRPVRAR